MSTSTSKSKRITFSSLNGAVQFMSDLHQQKKRKITTDGSCSPAPYLPVEIVETIAKSLTTSKDIGNFMLAVLCTKDTPRKSQAYKAVHECICRQFTDVNINQCDIYEASKVAAVIRRAAQVPFLSSLCLTNSGLGSVYVWTKVRVRAVQRVINEGVKNGTLVRVDVRGTRISVVVKKQLGLDLYDVVTDAHVRAFFATGDTGVEILW